MTFMPAFASSAARTPPAAPTPTMTTSVFRVAMTSGRRRFAGLRLQADDCRARECLFVLQVRRRVDRLAAGEAHQPPAGEVLVAAVHRIREQALDGVRAKRVEELLRRRPREAGRLALLECRDHLVLLRAVQPHERLAVRLAAVRLELRESPAVELLQQIGRASWRGRGEISGVAVL